MILGIIMLTVVAVGIAIDCGALEMRRERLLRKHWEMTQEAKAVFGS
jgi:hypothetical protein